MAVLVRLWTGRVPQREGSATLGEGTEPRKGGILRNCTERRPWNILWEVWGCLSMKLEREDGEGLVDLVKEHYGTTERLCLGTG